MDSAFKAFLITLDDQRKVSGRFTSMNPGDLDAGEVSLRVCYSGINYKDALAATGRGKIIRRFPCVGGIDMAGVVVASSDARFAVGDEVIATSFDIGVAHHGGFAELARVPGDWVVKMPSGLNLFESMSLGTAGFTAALAVMRMEACGLTPSKGPIIVTGATGGVGGLAIDMLAGLGYEVVALTGKAAEVAYLTSLGASAVRLRGEVDLEKVRPLEATEWAGAIDNLGGPILHWVLASMKLGGTVASIGNAADFRLDTTVFPFILRGVSLLGIDSANTGFPLRQQVWERLAGDLKPRHLSRLVHEISFDELPAAFDDFIAGKAKGRTVVRIAA